MKDLILYIGILKNKNFFSVENIEISSFIPYYKKSKTGQNIFLNSHLTKKPTLYIITQSIIIRRMI